LVYKNRARIYRCCWQKEEILSKKIVLIITSSIDVTVDYIIKKYNKVANFFRFNVDMLNQYEIGVVNEYGWYIKNKLSGFCLYKRDVYSIYYRKPIFPNLGDYEIQYRNMIQRDIDCFINGIANDFEGKVLSKPYILRNTENKVFQLLYAIKQGFNIPKSFIGNDNNIAEIFSGKCSIIKPLTIGKTYSNNCCEIYQTNMFSEFNEDISLTPIYLQLYQKKQYEVRLTIINKDVYAVRIDCDNKIDWRKDYSSHRYTVIDCPLTIKNLCYKMLEDLELKFGAFDFIVDEEDNWVFLEVNPNGQWQWLEEKLNLNISEKIVEYLVM
jgi:glutathione synthase/RimK-type ligase-like ATP-grasp enzyme